MRILLAGAAGMVVVLWGGAAAAQTSLCRITDGPRAGQILNYRGEAWRVGEECGDDDNDGVAVAPPPPRQSSESQFDSLPDNYKPPVRRSPPPPQRWCSNGKGGRIAMAANTTLRSGDSCSVDGKWYVE